MSSIKCKLRMKNRSSNVSRETRKHRHCNKDVTGSRSSLVISEDTKDEIRASTVFVQLGSRNTQMVDPKQCLR